jgi:D-alanine-D-alanine ligase
LPSTPPSATLQDLKREGLARCFIALHGRHGEDGTVQGALELLGLPYTGSGVMASAIAMDKVMTKRIWLPRRPAHAALGLAGAMPRARAAAHRCPTLGLPLIVKPPREGSSIGITKVAWATAQMQDACSWPPLRRRRAVRAVHRRRGNHLPGARPWPRRRRCRWCASSPRGQLRLPEQVLHRRHFKYLCPSGLPPAKRPRSSASSCAAYRALGCRGWGRADLMIRASDRQPFLLEMNTSPGHDRAFAGAHVGRAAGMSYEQLCLHLLASASLDGSR